MTDLGLRLRIIWLRCTTDLSYAQLGRRFDCDPKTIERIVKTNPFEEKQ